MSAHSLTHTGTRKRARNIHTHTNVLLHTYVSNSHQNMFENCEHRSPHRGVEAPQAFAMVNHTTWIPLQGGLGSPPQLPSTRARYVARQLPIQFRATSLFYWARPRGSGSGSEELQGSTERPFHPLPSCALLVPHLSTNPPDPKPRCPPLLPPAIPKGCAPRTPCSSGKLRPAEHYPRNVAHQRNRHVRNRRP